SRGSRPVSSSDRVHSLRHHDAGAGFPQTMSSHGRRRDHWTTSIDAVEALRSRIASVADFQDDPESLRLMAFVTHAKSSSFVALLDATGHVLDVTPAALIAGGVDRAEVLGLPLWSTTWWSDTSEAEADAVRRALVQAGEGHFARFDVDV